MGIYLGLISGTSMDAIDAAHNLALLNAIAALIAPSRVASASVLGLDPDYVEAVACAWFAKRTLEGLTSSAGSVTGARGARILGGVYRYA